MLDKVLEIREGRKNAKYEADIIWNGELLKNVSFGDRRYQHYKDSTALKLYSKLDHIRHRNNNGPSAVLSKKYLW